MASDQHRHSEEIQLETGYSPYPNTTPIQTAPPGLLPNGSDRVGAPDPATPTIPDRAAPPPPLTPNGTAAANGRVLELYERIKQDRDREGDGVAPNSVQQDELDGNALLGIGPADPGIQDRLRQISDSDLPVQDGAEAATGAESAESAGEDSGLAVHRLERKGHLQPPTDNSVKGPRSIVTDAGNQIYKDNQHQDQPPDTAVDHRSLYVEGKEDVSKRTTLAERLLKALEKTHHPQGSRPEKFLPKSRLDKLINVTSVYEELKPILANTETENRIMNIAKNVCKDEPKQIIRMGKPRTVCKSFRQIFAILVLIDRQCTISRFLESPGEVSDLDLPLLKRPDVEFKLWRRDGDRKPTTERLQCFEGWGVVQLDAFWEKQWLLLSPYFSRDRNNRIRHYKLDNDSILPFIPNPPPATTGGEKVDKTDEVEGGYARVFMVNIHEDHHNFRDQGFSNSKFAIKQLKNYDSEIFNREVEILRKFSEDHRHDHVVSLLATYEHGHRFHMIFHRARGNLLQFWTEIKPHPAFTHESVVWMSKQHAGIAEGLLRLHRHNSAENGAASESDEAGTLMRAATGETVLSEPDTIHPTQPAVPEIKVTADPNQTSPASGSNSPPRKDTLLFGRHTDIKPNNILWFDDQSGEPGGILQLADFGLSEFHSEQSKSPYTSKLGGWLPYRPPECDLGGRQRIRQAYDIWSLGCVYLEFVAWMLGGVDLLHRFTEERLSADVRSVGAFFVIMDESKTSLETQNGEPNGKPSEKPKAVLKPQVKDFISKLHMHENCTEYIHELLDMIQNNMLVVDSKERKDCSWVVDKLKSFREQCEADKDGYATRKNPWTKTKLPLMRVGDSKMERRPELRSDIVLGYWLLLKEGAPKDALAARNEHWRMLLKHLFIRSAIEADVSREEAGGVSG